ITPILIFFSGASAEIAMPSTAIAANSPMNKRAALCPGIKSSLEDVRFFVFICAYHIDSAGQCQAHWDASGERTAHQAGSICTSGLGRKLRFDEGGDKARHRAGQIACPAHQMNSR